MATCIDISPDRNSHEKITRWLLLLLTKSAKPRLTLETQQRLLAEGKRLIGNGYLRGDLSWWLKDLNFCAAEDTNFVELFDEKNLRHYRAEWLGQEIFEGLYS